MYDDENTTTTEAPTVADFLEEWGFLLKEGSGAPERGQIERIDAFWCQRGDCSETNIAALIALTGDQWAAVVSWCDTTGYGCQDGTDWKVCATRGEAISQGLDKESRGHLGLALPGEIAVTL